MTASLLLPSAAVLIAVARHSLIADAASLEKENEVKQILKRMESDVLAFRDAMEDLVASRCDAATLAECSRSNYNDCSSTYPGQMCMNAEDLVVPACGIGGSSCNALWSPSATDVRIPSTLADGPNGNPTDPRVIESVCYSRLAEPYMIENHERGRQMYFGSAHGSFRMIPARHSEVCGLYDPRRRPWFVAASSGPKDVVLVVDSSGSMDDYARMDMAKEAASTIVDTLTVADRFAIVSFSDVATQIGGEGRLMRATETNKERMIDEIRRLEADGATNFHAAFDAAFNAIDQTIREEATSGCNVAILFLTDGVITDGSGEEEVINLVNQRVANIATNHAQKTTIFTFSLGDKADHNVTKRIACSTNGIWTPVDDFADDLVMAMSSYYKLYALGLGEGGNEDWVAWVEPYRFHTAGKMGTSASAPVYDRSVRPPQFLGVATVDMWMDDLEKILGEDAASSTMLERFVVLSTARCPAMELTECEIDALRFAGGGEGATCGACGDMKADVGYEGILLDTCSQQGALPDDCWENTDMLGKDYLERACCESGGNAPSDACSLVEDDFENGNNLLIVQLAIYFVAAISFTFCVAKRETIMAKLHKTQPTSCNSNAESGTSTTTYVTAAPVSTSSFHEGNQATLQIEMGNSVAAHCPSQSEPGVEMSHEHENEMIRRDSIDPPAAAEADQAHVDALRRHTTRQVSIDPPEDEPMNDRAEMLLRSLSSAMGQDVAPVAAPASPINPDYDRRDATLSELEARLNNLSR
mmetsp:Transcript_33117/g.70581  ORF Transcript_33117/g.70581 Transcript_33117/m.70581 type:complete len:759 (+) Transcript_33117:360-2636(+)